MLQTRLLFALHSRPAFSASAVLRTAGFQSKPSTTVNTFINFRTGARNQALRTNGFHSKASSSYNTTTGFSFRSGLLANSLKSAPRSNSAFAGSPVLLTLRRSVSTEAGVITPASKEAAWKRLAIAAVRTSLHTS